MAINTYGVEPEDLRVFSGSIQIDTRSGLEDQLTEMILFSAGTVNAEAASAGVEAAISDSSDPTYVVLKAMVIMLTLDNLSIARNHGADNDLTYRKRYEDYRETLRGMPSKIDPGSSGKPDNFSSRAMTTSSFGTHNVSSLIKSFRKTSNRTGNYWE